ncbi:SRPBCC family protein [Paraherbaspirillum soli]|uniref:SRPBCC domain-containing protein n=1 Tax=Paraherbaspirillum soli TaxID=631222 RepID=A0ABW0MER0_9BURK
MHTPSPVTVHVKRHFAASPERVFDAWLDPDSAGQWLFATVSGRMVRVDIDARIGGKFVFVDLRGDEEVGHAGEYLAIERPRHLAFTFVVDKYSSDSTRVTVDIAPAEGGCELSLSHEGVYPDYASRTEAGWRGILDGLATTLGV